ncbi:MAG: MAPEG family protein [Deltaproteobacteria bacterium]|nr:MAPEG family protein [Deltaproteobacteria bacterium]MBW2447999.1 MAPEG family protein [Deltaproteobacteria bacterium]
MDWLALVALAALLQYFYFGILVGRSRTRTGIAAPAVTGDPVFERTFRVQQNSLEQLVIFLPAAYLFAHYVSAMMAAAIGVLYVVGRAVYAAGYIHDANDRGKGFLLTVLAQAVLVTGSLFGALRAIL